MKASEIISNSCCGQILDVPVFELANRVELLEKALRTCHTHHVMNDVDTPRIRALIKKALGEELKT